VIKYPVRRSSPTSPKLGVSALTKRVAPFIENVAESTTACLFMMVQGNLLALSLAHWAVASQTGLIAGILAAAAITISRVSKRWVVSLVLGVTTAIVDFFVHPGMFESVILEAVLTGSGAAILSYLVGMALHTYRARRAAQA
jgi:hypothetical protein